MRQLGKIFFQMIFIFFLNEREWKIIILSLQLKNLINKIPLMCYSFNNQQFRVGNCFLLSASQARNLCKNRSMALCLGSLL